MNVVVTQSDVVTAYGWGMDALWDGLLSGKTAIKTIDRFAERGFVSNQIAMVPELEVAAGQSRAMAMLERSLSQLVDHLDPLTPVILATTVGEIEFVERAVLDESPDRAASARPSALLERVKAFLGLRGTGMVISSACASSTAALTRAASMIRHGEAASVLLIAVDAISEFVYSGFSTLLSLCEQPARPFDADRSGLTLGEGVAWAIITSDEPAKANGWTSSIAGWGNTTDAVHMTAPDRNAGGLSRAISKACLMAKRPASDVAFVAAHGTATIYSDAMELHAFRGAIGEPRPIFSVKGGVGHTLAAAGLLQILVSARAMERRIVPPTVGLRIADESAAGWAFASPLQLAEANFALSTNSGFGGVNTAIVLAGRDVP